MENNIETITNKSTKIIRHINGNFGIKSYPQHDVTLWYLVINNGCVTQRSDEDNHII